MNDGDGISDKGYEIGGLPVWYHPLRYDVWFGLGSLQRANLRERIRAEQVASGADASDEAVENIYKQIGYADRRRGSDYTPLYLKQIRDRTLLGR